MNLKNLTLIALFAILATFVNAEADHLEGGDKHGDEHDDGHNDEFNDYHDDFDGADFEHDFAGQGPDFAEQGQGKP